MNAKIAKDSRNRTTYRRFARMIADQEHQSLKPAKVDGLILIRVNQR